MNLWTIPASDEQSLINIRRSLGAPVAPDTLGKFGLASPLFAWGAKPGHNNTKNVLERMKAGDICLFFTLSEKSHDKKYHWAGKIYQTLQSKSLAEAIWSDPAFELVYLMDEAWPISLTKEEWGQIAGYDARSPQGLSRVGDQITARILQKFASLGDWAKSLSAGKSASLPITPPPPPPLPPAQPSPKLNPVEFTRYLHKYASARGFNFAISEIRRVYAATRSKPFVILAGNSGTGKSRLVRLFAEACGATVKNGRFTMIPVRPDWNDSSELLGYLDLNGDFIPGKLVSAILMAHREPQRPFFVCLDEMNLARVEHYFSDFLSIVESRRSSKDGIFTDPVLHEVELKKMKADGLRPEAQTALNQAQSENKPISLPSNLFVFGTVNMDETTQPFSRKVVDRAHTLEFNDIDLLQGLDEVVTPAEVPALDLDQAFFRPEFTCLNDLLSHHRDRSQAIAKFVDSLNHDLAAGGFEVGYRVRDEAISFAVYADQTGLSAEEVNEAIVLQKILPRIHGSSPRVEKVLLALINRLKGDADVPEQEDPSFGQRLADLRADDEASAVLRKMAGMLLNYREENFTSFWLA
jgi:hypothetical protein